jgi:thiamine biosynthesis lipoprotein
VIGNLRRYSLPLLFTLLAIGAFALREPALPDTPTRFGGYTMGTTYSVQYAGDLTPDASAAIESAVASLLAELDKDIFSTYAPDSELSRLNASSETTVSLSAPLFSVLSEAQRLAVATEGAFDVTVAPLVDLWGFGPGRHALNAQVPREADIIAARERVGFQQLVLDAEAGVITRPVGVAIDLSAIAKGYGVDAVATLLEGEGVTDYFIEVGGELRIAGHKDSSKRGWVPAIEAPTDGDSQIYDKFFSRGESLAVAGSGDYRNYFESDGLRYSHEIDPRSGQPIAHTLAAVYVIHASAMTADALATAYMILGPEEAFETALAAGQAAYFIVRSGVGEAGVYEFSNRLTPAFARFLQEG